jgi:serine/threonine protein kinase
MITQETRYTLHEQLRQRDLATIYRATDNLSGRDAYVALLTDMVAADRATLAGLRAELPLLQNADPYLLTVLDYDLDRPPLYVMTEPLEGYSLRQLIENAGKGLLPSEALAYCSGAARCINAMHTRGAVHGFIFLDDFVLRGGEMLAISPRVAWIFGTSLFAPSEAPVPSDAYDRHIYTPPEQVDNPGLPNTSAGDVYRLGVLLYHLLTGVAPGSSPGSGEAAAWLRGGHTPNLTETIEDATLRMRLGKFIQVATSKDPARRWPDLKTFIAALEQINPGGTMSLPRIVITPRNTPTNENLNTGLHISLDDQQAVASVTTQTPPHIPAAGTQPTQQPFSQSSVSSVRPAPTSAYNPPVAEPPLVQHYAQPRVAYLVSVASGSVYAVNAPRVSVGVARTTDYVPDVNLSAEPPAQAQYVSQHHLDLIYDQGQWFARSSDIARNPTFVNGRQLSPGAFEPLSEGAALEIPALRLEFRTNIR